MKDDWNTVKHSSLFEKGETKQIQVPMPPTEQNMSNPSGFHTKAREKVTAENAADSLACLDGEKDVQDEAAISHAKAIDDEVAAEKDADSLAEGKGGTDETDGSHTKQCHQAMRPMRLMRPMWPMRLKKKLL